MNPIRRLARILFFLTLSTLARAADLPRVAVVPDTPEPSVAAFADFLSVSLAKASKQYALVERAELTKLASEAEIQKLAADQRPAALAKLAKADGLILVGVDKGDPKLPKLTLRLTSTHNGLVLRSLILGGKEDEYPQAADLAAGVLRFPCERLAHGDMKPPIIISLLGIRPAFEIDRALETTLNLAVAQQLSAQSGIAVSERWKMNDLVFERSLTDEKPQSFATGTVLLDGSYTRKGDEMEFSLRLRKAESETGKNLEFKGPATKPVELAQQIAKLVATESGQSGEAVAWNAIEEARVFAGLAKFLVERKLALESAQAYESAIALGDDTPETQIGRLRAYTSLVSPERGIDSYPPTEEDSEVLRNCPKAEFSVVVSCTLKLVRAMNAVADSGWRGFERSPYKPYQRCNFLQAVLSTGQMTLEAIIKRGEISDYATEARIIREQCRRIVDSTGPFVQGFQGWDIRVGYIFETPVETISAYRRMFDSRYLNPTKDSIGSKIRFFTWQVALERPIPVVDWSGSNPRAADNAWQAWLHELANSDALLSRADALALRFQTADDDVTRDKILGEYCQFLEKHLDWCLSPEGQLAFKAFGHSWMNGNPSFDNTERFIEVFAGFLEKVPWVEPNAYFTISGVLSKLPRPQAKKNGPFGKELAKRYLVAIDAYSIRAAQNPNWRKADQAKILYHLRDFRSRIMEAYPEIAPDRQKDIPAAEGAVAINAWMPDASLSSSGSWIESSHLRWDGKRLLVPLAGPRMISLEPQTLVGSAFDFPKRVNPDWSMAVSGGRMMVYADDALLLSDYEQKPGVWKEIEDMGAAGSGTNFQVSAHDGSFFIGAIPTYEQFGNSEVKQTLIGKYSDGRFDWIVSSSRRPEKHPLDAIKPIGFLGVFPGWQGRPMVQLGVCHGILSRQVHDLETGKLVANLGFGSGRYLDGSGDLPLAYAHDHGEMMHAYLFDPAREKPLLLFRNSKTKTGFCGVDRSWEKVKPVFDHKRPEFQGEVIALIWRSGKLWMLKWDTGAADVSAKHDPDSLRLVCADPATGNAVVVPLRYDVPEGVRKFKAGNSDMSHPVIDQESVLSTPDRLFFAAGRKEDFTFHRQSLSPVLFYVRWKNVITWINVNHPEFQM